ncbi:MAG: hypothetical protein P4L11_16160 [Geothrix sp.]|nr:hypothetical protein [Geothrix sp.]
MFLGLVLACGPPATGPGSGRGAMPSFAVWSYRDLPGSTSEQAAFFKFAERQGVRELFLGAADLLPGRAEALAAFLDAARQRGLAVSLVLDMDSWARPDQRPAALEAVRAVRDFDLEQARAGRARLAALQIDVEPHALPDWERNGARLSGDYLDLLEAVKAGLAGGPPLHVDIPVWWQGRPIQRQGRTRPLSEWVIQLADRTVLMDYRNRVKAIVEDAEGPLAAADALGRPVLIGLAVHCDRAPDNATTSFCGHGEGALFRAMRKANARLRRHPSYAGMAVFTYEDWLILKR